MFEIIVYILAWGFVVRFIIKTESSSGASKSKRTLWFLFWIFTLSFLFSSSASSSVSSTTSYGGYDDEDWYNYNDECDDYFENCCEDDFWDSDGD